MFDADTVHFIGFLNLLAERMVGDRIMPYSWRDHHPSCRLFYDDSVDVWDDSVEQAHKMSGVFEPVYSGARLESHPVRVVIQNDDEHTYDKLFTDYVEEFYPQFGRIYAQYNRYNRVVGTPDDLGLMLEDGSSVIVNNRGQWYYMH